MPHKLSEVGKTLPPEFEFGPLTMPCKRCGGTNGYVIVGQRPHAAGLYCFNCGRHIAWLSKSTVAQIEREGV